MRKFFLIVGLLLAAVVADWFVHGRLTGGSTELASSSSRVEDLFRGDPLATLEGLEDYVEDPARFTAESCVADIETARARAARLNPQSMDFPRIQRDLNRIVDRSFRVRRALASRLAGFSREGVRGSSHPCVRAVRAGLRTLRFIEDYLILTVLNPRPFDEKKDPKAGPALNEAAPKLVTVSGEPVRLRSGDLLLSRGNASTSAAISRIGVDEAQFSHLSQVYIEGPPGTEVEISKAAGDPRVHTIEAHIEIGSFTRTFGKYLEDGNARVAQYRPKLSPELAHRAAKAVFDRVRAYQERSRQQARRDKPNVNDNPPYDFKMDNADHSQIFCAEIVTIAFESVGLKLPTYPTVLKKNDITQRMEISVPAAFAPADIEIEPNFEELAEWRDVRKLDALLRKDAVLTSMYEWMENRKYRLQDSPTSYAKAVLAWTVRQLDLGFSEALPKNMNRQVIRMTFTLDTVVGAMEDRLKQRLAEEIAKGRRYRFTPAEQAVELEKFRAEDEARFRNPLTTALAKFHWRFSPSP